MVSNTFQLGIEILEQTDSPKYQTRTQLNDYCRQEQFLAAEKSLFQSLPRDAFELRYYRFPKIALNGHVYLGRHYYSVPCGLVGRKLEAYYTRNLVQIFDKESA